MRKSIFILAAAMAAAAPSASALTVFDPTNYAENARQAATAVEQFNKQVDQLNQQIKQYQDFMKRYTDMINQVSSIAKDPFSAIGLSPELAQLKDTITQAYQQLTQMREQIMSQANSLQSLASQSPDFQELLKASGEENLAVDFNAQVMSGGCASYEGSSLQQQAQAAANASTTTAGIDDLMAVLNQFGKLLKEIAAQNKTNEEFQKESAQKVKEALDAADAASKAAADKGASVNSDDNPKNDIDVGALQSAQYTAANGKVLVQLLLAINRQTDQAAKQFKVENAARVAKEDHNTKATAYAREEVKKMTTTMPDKPTAGGKDYSQPQTRHHSKFF
jgi:P-type conjugative transfer protein TrbJ